MNLANLRIGFRLSIGFGIVLLLLCLTGAVAEYEISRVYAGTNELATNTLPNVETLGDIRDYANMVRRLSLRLTTVSDPNERNAQKTQRNNALVETAPPRGAVQNRGDWLV